MRNKKSVLKILSANSECFSVSAGIAGNNFLRPANNPNIYPSAKEANTTIKMANNIFNLGENNKIVVIMKQI